MMSSTNPISTPIEGANAQPQNTITFESHKASFTQTAQVTADKDIAADPQLLSTTSVGAINNSSTQAPQAAVNKDITASTQPSNAVISDTSATSFSLLTAIDKNVSTIALKHHDQPSNSKLHLRGGGRGTPKKKRRSTKEVLRCNHCVRLHKQCDLNHPTCGRCQECGKLCEWSEPALEPTSEEEEDGNLALGQLRSFDHQEDNMPSQHSRIIPKFDEDSSAEKDFKVPKDNRSADAPDTVRTFRNGRVLDTRAARTTSPSSTSNTNMIPFQPPLANTRQGVPIRRKRKPAKGGKKKSKKGKKGKKPKKEDEETSSEEGTDEEEDGIAMDEDVASARDRPTIGGKTVVPAVSQTTGQLTLTPVGQLGGNTSGSRGRASGPSSTYRHAGRGPAGSTNPFGVPEATLEAIAAQERGEFRDMAQATRAANANRANNTPALSYFQDDFNIAAPVAHQGVHNLGRGVSSSALPRQSEDDFAAPMPDFREQRNPPRPTVIDVDESLCSDSEYPPQGVRPPGVPWNSQTQAPSQMVGAEAEYAYTDPQLLSGQTTEAAAAAAEESSSEESLPDANLGQWDLPQGRGDGDGGRTPPFLHQYFEPHRSPTPEPEPITRDPNVDYYAMAGLTEDDFNEASEFYKYF